MFDLDNNSIRVSKLTLTYNSFSRNLYFSHNFRLCLVDRGSGIWQIGEKSFHVKTGDVVLLNNRIKRVFKDVSSSAGIELLVIEFEPQMFMKQFQSLFWGNDQKRSCIVSQHAQINLLLKEIESEAEKKLLYSHVMIGAKLVEVFSLMMRHYDISDTCSLKMSEEMYKVLSYIDNNYMTELSLRKLAEIMNMSESNLSRNFKKCMGVGFAQYLMNKRVNYAIYLLQTSEKTVLEIALHCGFNNTASFYKAFKKITNRNPKDYRDRGEAQYYI